MSSGQRESLARRAQAASLQARETRTIDQIVELLIRAKAACASADPPRPGDLVSGYRPLPALSRSRLGEIEDAIGTKLPVEYETFITTVANGGSFGVCHVFPVEDALRGFIREPFVVESTTFLPGQNGYRFPMDAPLSGCIGLTDYGCGSFAVLAVLGEQRGNVWEFHGAADALWRTYSATFFQWLAGQILMSREFLKANN